MSKITNGGERTCYWAVMIMDINGCTAGALTYNLKLPVDYLLTSKEANMANWIFNEMGFIIKSKDPDIVLSICAKITVKIRDIVRDYDW